LPAFAIPIGDIHVVTSSGIQNNPYPVGTTVTVTGVVITPDSTFSDANTEVQVQDSTGAITVFRAGGISLYHYGLGDSVTVTGQIAQFNGLTEISNASIVTLYSTGNYGLVVPLVKTCKQVRDSTINFNTLREDGESRLIRINNVTMNGGTWPQLRGEHDGHDHRRRARRSTCSSTGTARSAARRLRAGSSTIGIRGSSRAPRRSLPAGRSGRVSSRTSSPDAGPELPRQPDGGQRDSVSADIVWLTDAASSASSSTA
jgi:hypothetical protein